MKNNDKLDKAEVRSVNLATEKLSKAIAGDMSRMGMSFGQGQNGLKALKKALRKQEWKNKLDLLQNPGKIKK